MRLLSLLLVSLFPAFAQVSELATDRTGATLLFTTRFRLQTDADGTTEQKIYRLRNGVWSRMTLYTPTGGIIPGSITDPFISGDIYGWTESPSHGLFPVVRIHGEAVVNGLTLPEGFPREVFRLSSNGRYAAGWTLDAPAEVWDSMTGSRTVLPLNARNPQVADDGTYAYSTEAGNVVVQPPTGSSRTIAATGTLRAITADAQWVAVIAADSSLRIAATASGALAAILPTSVTRDGRPSWALANTGVVFLADHNRQVMRWDSSSGQVKLMMEAPDPFAGVVLSADGGVAWVVSETNWLLKFDLKAGVGVEVLPPLGHISNADVRGVRVPGSAVLLPGIFTRQQQVTVLGELWPLSDVNAEGYWAQVPWEWRGAGGGVKETLRVRTQLNPFEDVASVAYDGTSLPNFLRRADPDSPRGWILAAHQDFRGLVTPQSPARASETIHVYMTGLGPLQRPLPTGAPGPADAVRIAGPLTCVGVVPGSVARTAPLAVPAAMFAPGMIGFYQVDVTIPAGVPNGEWFLQCGDGSREAVALVSTRP